MSKSDPLNPQLTKLKAIFRPARPAEAMPAILSLLFLRFVDLTSTSLPDHARYNFLLTQNTDNDPVADISTAVDAAIGDSFGNESLADLTEYIFRYRGFTPELLQDALREIVTITEDQNPAVIESMFYWVIEFYETASSHSREGIFQSPISMMQLVITILDPTAGKLLDPATGKNHYFKLAKDFLSKRNIDVNNLEYFGQELNEMQYVLGAMAMAISGITAELNHGDSLYEAKYGTPHSFDFVATDFPWGMNIDVERAKHDERYSLQLTRNTADSAWIQIILSALNDSGRAGFSLSSNSTDRQQSMRIRKHMVDDINVIDTMLLLPPGFYRSTHSESTLWFLDKNKIHTEQSETVLFIDAEPLSLSKEPRKLRYFDAKQIEFIANIRRLYRKMPVILEEGSESMLAEYFPQGVYKDLEGICKAIDINQIQENDYSLYPPRFIDYPQPTKKFGKWIVQDIIGSGNQAVVYKVVHEGLDNVRALKLQTDENNLDEIISEAKKIAKIQSDSVVEIYDAGIVIDHTTMEEIDRKRPGRSRRKRPRVGYYVMPFFERGNLQDERLNNGHEPGVSQVLRLLTEIIIGLKAVHAEDLVHGDVKPTNILIKSNGTNVLADFGISLDLQSMPETTDQRQDMLYAAPETVDGIIDKRSDIYSLGATLFWYWTNRDFPIYGNKPPTWSNTERNYAELCSLIEQMASKEPELRPTIPEIELLRDKIAGKYMKSPS